MILRIKRYFEICDMFSGFGDGQTAFFQFVGKGFIGYLIPLDGNSLIRRDNVVVRGIDY